MGCQPGLHQLGKGELVGERVQRETTYPEKGAPTRRQGSGQMITGFQVGTDNEYLSPLGMLIEPRLRFREATGRRRGSNNASFWHATGECYQEEVRFALLIICYDAPLHPVSNRRAWP